MTNGARYERELRDISVERYGAIAFRSGGSLRVDNIVIQLLRNGGGKDYTRTFLAEVKSTRNPNAWYFSSKRDKSQLAYYNSLSMRGAECVYAVRHKSGSRKNRWRFHPLEVIDLSSPGPLYRDAGLTIDEWFIEKAAQNYGLDPEHVTFK